MSVYERMYEISYDRLSHYSDDPKEILRMMEEYPDSRVYEGYPVYRDVGDGREEITRRTIGPVSRQTLVTHASTLDFLRQRAKVQSMIRTLRSTDDP